MGEYPSNESEEKAVSLEIPEWLSPEIFNDTIRDDIDNFLQIKDMKIAPAVSTGENYMTVLLRVLMEVELQDATTTSTSYMVKILPNSEPRKGMVSKWKVFEKEKNTYRNYIPEFEEMYSKVGRSLKFGPKQLVVQNSKLPEDILMMEDLRLRGFENVPRQNGLDLAHTKSALEKVAQFHAASACRFEAKGPYPDMYSQCLCAVDDGFVDYREGVAKQVQSCLDLYKAPHLSEKLKTYSRETMDQFQAVAKVDPEAFNVLNHGDLWSNNIMFKHDSMGNILDTLLIDLQMSRYCSPAQDLQYLLLSSTCLENKFALFDYFIQYYHEKLMENLTLLNYPKKHPTLKDLHISMFINGDWAYTISTALLPIVLMDPTATANMENFLRDDEEGNDFKRDMYRNKLYVQHMQQFLPWMERRGLLECGK